MAYSKGITLTDLLAALRSEPPARRGSRRMPSPRGGSTDRVLGTLLPAENQRYGRAKNVRRFL